jgi:predicted dehydrogenase
MKEKCLIIGLGQIGMMYDYHTTNNDLILTHAKAFQIHQDFEIVGGVDYSQSNRQLFVEKYCKPAYESLILAFEEQTPSIVVISTPTNTHFDIIREIVKNNGIKVILCEKPLDYSYAKSLEILQLCELHNIKLFVNYIRRTDPGASIIKQYLEDKIIKLPLKGVVWYSNGLLNNGSHFFNLLEFWLGDCLNAKVISSGRKLNNFDIDLDLEVEFESGKIYFFSVNEVDFSHYSIELISPSGRLRYENGGDEIIWQGTKKSDLFQNYLFLDEDQVTIENDMKKYQMNVTMNLSLEIQGIKTNLCTGEQALKTTKALTNILNF